MEHKEYWCKHTHTLVTVFEFSVNRTPNIRLFIMSHSYYVHSGRNYTKYDIYFWHIISFLLNSKFRRKKIYFQKVTVEEVLTQEVKELDNFVSLYFEKIFQSINF